MAKLQGTILASKIVPTDSLDTYATHDDKYGRGGHRSVDTLEERDNITTPRRKEGMTVYVKENKTKYILENGIENVNWKVDSSGGGSGGEVDLNDYYKKTETYSKVEVDTKIADIPTTDLSNYYSKTEVDTKIAEIPPADLTNYYEKSEVDNLISGASEVDLTNYYTKEDTDGLLDTKQDNLMSGTNIKTINGQSVLGNGNLLISAEADLSNYYTKPQVDEFINDIYIELNSPSPFGEYGIRWNPETDIYEVLGATNRTQIQRNMKRCVLKDDGIVNYYLDPYNSTLKEDGTPAVLTGADGNVMVEVPKFWYKHELNGDEHQWWVSNEALAGYSIHPWFLEGGVERPFRYYRAYTCTNVGGKLRSISGSTLTRNQTRATFRTQARANGAGWELCSWNALNAIQLLFLTEYCTFNSQAVLGRGNDAGGDYGATTGQSNSIGNRSSGATNNDMWMSYRGIENWYADCWEFIDGINIQNYKVFLNQNPSTFADDVFTGDYVDSGVTIPAMSSSYIKKISGNFLPTSVGGSSSTFVTDGGWSNSAGTLVIFGGHATAGFLAGGFTFAAHLSSAYLGSDISAGLSR